MRDTKLLHVLAKQLKYIQYNNIDPSAHMTTNKHMIMCLLVAICADICDQQQ